MTDLSTMAAKIETNTRHRGAGVKHTPEQIAAHFKAKQPAKADATAKPAPAKAQPEPKEPTVKKTATPKQAPAPKAAAAKPKEAKAPKANGAAKLGQRAQAEADAKAGKLPKAPDFSAPSHKRWRGKLEEVQALVKAGDAKGLKGYKLPNYSSSPVAIARYRDLAVMALEARK
jgi:hypothetical protein